MKQIALATTETPIKSVASLQRSKVLQNTSNVKVMEILVYDCDGVILTHAFPE